MTNPGIIIKVNEADLTPERLKDYMNLLSDMKCNSYMVLPTEVELDWYGMCVDVNIRSWLRQMRCYFGWQ